MKEIGIGGTASQNLETIVRQADELPPDCSVKISFLKSGETLPLVLQPETNDFDLAGWARSSRDWIETQLLNHGALLFRRFNLTTAHDFEALARAISPKLLDYRERSSPRSEVGQGIYTSTDHPADQVIHFHNEQSYTKSWPMKLWFFCLTPAKQGGATPIADGRKILNALDPKIRERFLERKVMYVRNYGDGMGLSWQTAFQTTAPSEVEAYCRQADISFEWTDGNRLRTQQVFDAVVAHPKTSEMVWFEHTAFFHVSSLDQMICEALLEEYREEELPFNTYYGDGSPIEISVLDEIREAYRTLSVSFPWQQGDALLIDNMLTSHGRESFIGPRKILVAMAELYPDRATCENRPMQ